MIGYDSTTHYARIGDTTQLFLDNSMVHWIRNIKRTHHKAVKHSDNPLIKQDKPWEEMPYFTTCYSIVRDDDGTFKCWYSDFLLSPKHERPVPYLGSPWWDSRLCWLASRISWTLRCTLRASSRLSTTLRYTWGYSLARSRSRAR